MRSLPESIPDDKILDLGLIVAQIADAPTFSLQVYDLQTPKGLADINGINPTNYGNDRVTASRGKVELWVKRRRIFRVNKHLVLDHSFSSLLDEEYGNRLNNRNFRKNAQPLKVENVDSLEVILREAHGRQDEKTFNATICTVWGLKAVACDWGIDLSLLYDWFAAWFDIQREENGYAEHPGIELSEILQDAILLFYPGIWFKHAEALRWSSQFLIYNAPQSVDRIKPKYKKMLHKSQLDNDVYRQMHGAKRDIVNRLFRKINDACRHLKRPRVGQCCKLTFWEFATTMNALCHIDTYALDTGNRSVTEVCQDLSLFNMATTIHGCHNCDRSCDTPIQAACEAIRAHNDGLCLKCIEDSTKGEGEDEEYWKRGEARQWSRGCPFQHGQATWFHSWVGDFVRKQKRVKELKAEWKSNGVSEDW